MDMAMRNAIQLHIADQLQNVWDSNERQFSERHDAFELTNRQFVKLFRLKKETANLLINIVEENSKDHLRSSALGSTTQVLTALRFFGAGSYQNCVGNNINMAISQPSVSRCIHDVINVLNLPQVLNG